MPNRLLAIALHYLSCRILVYQLPLCGVHALRKCGDNLLNVIQNYEEQGFPMCGGAPEVTHIPTLE